MLRALRIVCCSLAFSMAAVLAAQTVDSSARANVVDATLLTITPQMQSLVFAGRTFTRVDAYYDAQTKVWSVIFVDDPAHPESYANQIILNFYNWKPSATPELVANQLSAERAGHANIFLFKAPERPGGAMTYNLVTVQHGRNDFVYCMSVQSWESSVVNINFGHRIGSAVDVDALRNSAKSWLASDEGRSFINDLKSLRVGAGWAEHLKKIK